MGSARLEPRTFQPCLVRPCMVTLVSARRGREGCPAGAYPTQGREKGAGPRPGLDLGCHSDERKHSVEPGNVMAQRSRLGRPSTHSIPCRAAATQPKEDTQRGSCPFRLLEPFARGPDACSEAEPATDGSAPLTFRLVTGLLCGAPDALPVLVPVVAVCAHPREQWCAYHQAPPLWKAKATVCGCSVISSSAR